ncbi:queuine tRNA-ribosyltransferase domain-containing protein [Hirsutella rhossiliensis]|uniref:Queuine tRNA-ribosyltransferase domain-containing protein n=1 Tax=Hirsutella rhossiliensis TaxID=111463 RepID=A0A9P8SGY7_9HYPO|nr:queuine tRNA-ribosyltransferase domain-containing protein [Hirsutella rhossiliensis]KAH0960980.1 queuine tRNA-ribosyltransferase domain-containing protein [Hirsutella rhossiliensis]
MSSLVHSSPALTFELVARCSTTRARASTIKLPHGPVQLPIFMPVATQASLKGITPQQLEETGCVLCLNNTYHLGLKPGQEVLDAIGGAHKLQGWNHNILTDSGGFQMVSLLKLAKVMEEGLDDVLVTTCPDKARMREAMERSTQNLFCIIQGGLDLDMRRLSGGEAKTDYCRVVATCTALLPELKPRYVMGIGYPEDLVVSVALGADMFDCVWPTRTARFGNAVTKHGVLNLRGARFANDFGPIESGCGCASCRTGDGGMGITRAFVHHNASKETIAAHVLTIHNVWYQLNLMKEIRESVIEDRFPDYIRHFFASLHANKTDYPEWAVEALRGVGVDLMSE